MFSSLTFGYSSHPAFGHGAAQFKQLVTFLAAVSLVLWACVLLTIVLRMWLCHVWYRRRYRVPNNNPPPP
jgi:hypothetical protein